MKVLTIICGVSTILAIVLCVTYCWIDTLRITRGNWHLKETLDSIFTKVFWSIPILIIITFMSLHKYSEQQFLNQPVIEKTYEITYADLTKDTVSFTGRKIDVDIVRTSKYSGENNLHVYIDKKLKHRYPFVVMYKKL